jgi:hypothetical protein
VARRLDRLVVLALAASAGACGSGPAATSAADGEPDGGGEASVPVCPAVAVADPDLATSTAWTPTPEAILTPGAATFSTAAICDHAAITQPLAGSALACARPLVLSIDATFDDIRLLFAVGAGGDGTCPWSRPGRRR